WLLADLSSYNPPRVILDQQPVCGMCHNFSQDGKRFIMDLDVGGDKGAFVLSPVKKHVEVTQENIISWTPFQNGGITLGLFPKISPDGKYILATIKERSVFIKINDPRFSELFFPFTGVLACYSVENQKFFLLPGADQPEFVHLGPAWSPDGKYIVFSRARVNKEFFDLMGDQGSLTAEENIRIDDLNKKHKLRYDLYLMPFNNGRGGEPKPLAGAAHNGMSNYWPRYSPDGRWIVFTRSPNALMNQPGSELFIVPAAGGEARRMTCGRAGHNSWHSWSPNGRWLVFVSKVNTPYTELFLAHVDEDGQDSPPIHLRRLSSDTMASVLPEFANIGPEDLWKITVRWIEALGARGPVRPAIIGP
ncbi:MAG: hypothetical protein AB1896_12175, partial [Thermodesulfobacteriota bacterium]